MRSIHDIRSTRGDEDADSLALLKRVASKDRVAFETLYRRFQPILFRYLTRMMRRPELVEEVVNDTLFVVWEKAAQFEGRSKVSTWITGIAYLKGIKALDRLRRVPDQQADPFEESDEIEASDNAISRLGTEQWVSSALEQISADQRSVVELTYFFGYSYQEIAEVMDCPVNTVKTRMFHARRRLAKLLPQLEEQTSDRASGLSADSDETDETDMGGDETSGGAGDSHGGMSRLDIESADIEGVDIVDVDTVDVDIVDVDIVDVDIVDVDIDSADIKSRMRTRNQNIK